MSDILHGYPATLAPVLTCHMCAILQAEMRAEIQRAEIQRAKMPRDRRQRTENQAARYWRLTDHIERTAADLAALGAV